MPRSTPLPSKLCLLLALLVLAACSRVELVYRNLDWLIPWKLDDYLSLDAEQGDWLDARLDEQLHWHCSSQLPRYLEWLERGRPLLAGNPSAEQIEAPLSEARELLQATLQHLAPDAVQLLAGLSAGQIDELGENLSAEQAELSEEYLGGTLEERLQRRVSRMQGRLEDWLGPLHPLQQAYLRHWSVRQEASVRPWLAYRQRWQTLLLDNLRAPQTSDLPVRLEPLLSEPERYWGEEYRHSVRQAQQALAELLSETWASATPTQREHLQTRLQALSDDLAELVCRG